uniref:Uncharacterized protein n=1 Tax=Tanacetum cinerariifolium TaxID=118510 RepID=A0A6L2N4P1_TANCI|nr:hypothetical protein [Tanacetum cinerariifolium]
MRLVNGIFDFGSGVITVYPEQDPFEDDYEKTEKSMDDQDQLLDFNFDDIPQLDGEELSSFVCKMGKSSRNKKRAMENLNLFYPDIKPSSSPGRHLTEEEAANEALALRISKKFALLEEVSPVLEIMAYNDKSDVLRTTESDSDDEEEYEIKRNKFGAPIYGLKLAAYLNCNDQAERSLALKKSLTHSRRLVFGKRPLWEKTLMKPNHQDPNALDNMKLWKRMECHGKIDEMLRIKLREAGSNEEIFTSVTWIRAFNINEPIYSELFHEFYSTYEFDEVCADDELKPRRSSSLDLVTTKPVCECGLVDCKVDEEKKELVLKRRVRFVVDSLSRSLLGRSPRASMQDLYEKMGSMEIRHGAIERIAYRQSYHWDRYAGVFEHMVGVYSVPL